MIQLYFVTLHSGREKFGIAFIFAHHVSYLSHVSCLSVLCLLSHVSCPYLMCIVSKLQSPVSHLGTVSRLLCFLSVSRLLSYVCFLLPVSRILFVSCLSNVSLTSTVCLTSPFCFIFPVCLISSVCLVSPVSGFLPRRSGIGLPLRISEMQN